MHPDKILIDTAKIVLETHNSLSDWLSTFAQFVALIGGSFAIVQYFYGRNRDRQQREDELDQRRVELRWRQAEAGKRLLDDMLDDPQAQTALEMLDSWSREFEIAPGERVIIRYEEWIGALNNSPDSARAPMPMFVRDCFDSLFYYMDVLEHDIVCNFVQFEDVSFPLSYYVKILAEDKDTHEKYLKDFGFEQTSRFLARFTDWVGQANRKPNHASNS